MSYICTALTNDRASSTDKSWSRCSKVKELKKLTLKLSDDRAPSGEEESMVGLSLALSEI